MRGSSGGYLIVDAVLSSHVAGIACKQWTCDVGLEFKLDLVPLWLLCHWVVLLLNLVSSPAWRQSEYSVHWIVMKIEWHDHPLIPDAEIHYTCQKLIDSTFVYTTDIIQNQKLYGEWQWCVCVYLCVCIQNMSQVYICMYIMLKAHFFFVMAFYTD